MALTVAESSGGCAHDRRPGGGLDLDLFPPGNKVTLLLYEEVSNADDVRDKLLDGQLPEFALINPDVIASPFHVAVAATTALMHEAQGSLNVKSLHAELVYWLSPTRKISDCFRNFGAGKGDTKVLVALINAQDDAISKVSACIQGKQVDDVKGYLDAPLTPEREARLRKVFKLAAAETDVEQSVISRVAGKKVL